MPGLEDTLNNVNSDDVACVGENEGRVVKSIIKFILCLITYQLQMIVDGPTVQRFLYRQFALKDVPW